MKTNLKKTYLIICLLTILVINSCTSSEQEIQVTNANIALSGWKTVSFDVDEKFILKNKGHLDEVYDEYVGILIDDGLDINQSHWLKPTYGNENIIWTLNSSIGSQKIISLQKSKSMFEESGYKYLNGGIKSGNTSWEYSGYSTPPTSSDTSTFKSYIFVCQKNNGVSVFYWGNNNIDQPQKMNEVTEILKQLSDNC